MSQTRNAPILLCTVIKKKVVTSKGSQETRRVVKEDEMENEDIEISLPSFTFSCIFLSSVSIGSLENGHPKGGNFRGIEGRVRSSP